MKLVVQELTVNAPAQVLYELLTDPELFVQWMAEDATLDPRPGGVVRWTHANGDTCSGRYVELEPARRVVFTYGWERADVEIPPGSTTVEIDLTPTEGSSTLLRLVHRGLDDLAAGAHDGGWVHYLDRLRRRAEGSTVGPDPFSTQRVPTQRSSADESAGGAWRSDLLGRGRTTARDTGGEPFDDDGPAVPPVERRLLRLMGSSKRRPARQARRDTRRRAGRLETGEPVRSSGPPVPRVGGHPGISVEELEASPR